MLNNPNTKLFCATFIYHDGECISWFINDLANHDTELKYNNDTYIKTVGFNDVDSMFCYIDENVPDNVTQLDDCENELSMMRYSKEWQDG